MWLALLTGAIGFGGFFAVYSYVAPLATRGDGAPRVVRADLLVVLGVGMTIGNLIGGRRPTAGVLRALFISFGALAAVARSGSR